MLVMADNKPPHNRPPDNRPPDRGQETSQTQTQEATAKSSSRASSESVSGAEASATGGSAHAQGGEGGAGGAGGAASATNDGVQNSTEINSRTENNSTNIVLVPNNNTENCLRVWGLSFGREGTAGGIGVPTRSAACDFEQAADDAAALGNHRLAWYWRCHKKNIYKPFKQNGEQKEVAIRQCYTEMWQLLAPEPDPTPVGYQLVSDDEYEELLMAQVQQEEIEQLEDRYAQQQSLIEEMQEEDKQQADIRAQFKARLARYEEGEDGDEDDGRED
jgi:hypothetical protein